MSNNQLLLELSTQVQDEYKAKKLTHFQAKSLRIALFAAMIEIDKLEQMKKQTVFLEGIMQAADRIP